MRCHPTIFLTALLTTLTASAIGQDGILGTIAGSTAGYRDGTAAEAQFQFPTHVAVSPLDSSVYFSDAGSNTIRKRAPDGQVTTVAGINGEGGYTGDGEAATKARLSAPGDLVVDSAGHLYVADVGNNVVRKIDAKTGVISTVAGTGVASYDGTDGLATLMGLNLVGCLAVDVSDNLYLADTNNGLIRKVTPAGTLTSPVGDFEAKGASTGDNGPATLAGLNRPSAVAVAADGTLYLAELDGHKIRCVSPKGIITTYAGTGIAGFAGDDGLATLAQFNFDVEYPAKIDLDANGNLLIADSANGRIRAINTATGIISTVAGKGTFGYSGDGKWGTEGEFGGPVYGVACSPKGNFVIADPFNYKGRDLTLNFTSGTGVNVAVPISTEATITFDSVVASGDISIDRAPTSEKPAPGYLSLQGQYYDVTFTGTFAGSVSVTIKYSDTGLSADDELQLKILHNTGTQWVDVTLSVDTDSNLITAKVTSLSPFVLALPEETITVVNFRRGDSNADGVHDISDAVFTLLHLFGGGPMSTCDDAVDANDDGALDLTDAIHVLHWLFTAGAPPAIPGPGDVGLDPTSDDLTCEAYAAP